MNEFVCRPFVGARRAAGFEVAPGARGPRTRWSGRLLSAALLLGLAVVPLWLGTTRDAQALEAVNGRVQAHGFVEMQLRALNKNYTDQWDLAQWYNIFNLELEVDLLQETVGPLDLVSGYVRVEARFDCVYSRGCGIVKPVNTYGDRAKTLPGRLNRGDLYTTAGQITLSNDGPITNRSGDPLLLQQTPGFEGIYDGNEEGPGVLNRSDLMQCRVAPCGPASDTWAPWGAPVRFWNADRNQRWAEVDGPAWETMDDGTNGAPFLVAMEEFKDFKFASIPISGGGNSGHAIALFGPWLPENFVEPNASMADFANPLDFSRVSPQSLSQGSGAAPNRPIPIFREDDPERSQIYIRALRPQGTTDPELDSNGNPLDPQDAAYGDTSGWQIINPNSLDARTFNDRAAEAWEARGLFVPSPNLVKGMQEGTFDTYNFNFTEEQRAFNRGASQQDEGELKEAYLDIEMFDSRLWMRVGKQTIVWGKTELFRTTDQFNPQDFALANLPSLEESRIALWAWRGVWSFYEVGPLSDVRAEVAFNFDQFESADLGACGEPYTINLVCSLTFGSYAHGFLGIGVAGQEQPPNPWDDIRGMEIGGRLEFRWDRYSFAITDFYGYDDFPHVKRLSSYNRNVDWRSGRPRMFMHTEQDLALNYAGTVGRGCATPNLQGIQTTAAGAIDNNGPLGYVTYDGSDETGCLTPGPISRGVNPDGTPFQVPSIITGNDNSWQFYRGQFWNDTSRADPNDPRPNCFYGTGGVGISASCLSIAGAYDPRYDPNNQLSTVYGVPNGRFDSIQAKDKNLLWLNSYDPQLEYDERNALQNSPVNLSVFNWVCATTVGFNELDPGACATTVFSSSKPAGSRLDSPVSQVISGILGGSPLINANIGKAAGDDVLSKFSITPELQGVPLVSLDTDAISTLDDQATQLNEVLYTYDRRQKWAVDRGVPGAQADLNDMLIRSRESESYNCLSRGFFTGNNDHFIGCGGFAWFGQQPQGGVDPRRANLVTYLASTSTPEQEALLGCGPFFQTECDSNGIDLLWAEGSALLQSFIGNDSLGFSFDTLGLAGLVPAEFGTHLMDNNSVPLEYRTDSRVIGTDGQLIRLDASGNPELGTAVGAGTGLTTNGNDGNPCDLSYSAFVQDQAAVLDPGNSARITFAAQNRWNSRCWDLREYYTVKGIQPGTATFEILGLGGPKCTTDDIGGPGGAAGILPGCRNKWATIRYSASGAADHPNNPASGYIGNNYLGDPNSALVADVGLRTDYRQVDLTSYAWCPASNPDCNVEAPDPLDLDQNGSLGSGLNWGVFSPDEIPGCTDADRNTIENGKPKCWLGGWVQEVDGDPDSLGIRVEDYSIDFPKSMNATSGLQVNGTGIVDLGGFGNVVQRDYLGANRGIDSVPSGCTEMQAWIWMQRVSDAQGGGYLNHPECAAVQVGAGAGHPFTGESFANEISGISFNFMMLLVAFSEEFTDGIASVRGFVNPEIYDAKLYSDQPITQGDANCQTYIPGSTAPCTNPRPRLDPDLYPAPPDADQAEKDRLQRDPSLISAISVFPDLRYYEQQSAWGLAQPNIARRLRLGISTGASAGQGGTEIARGNNGKIFSQGPNGTQHVWRGLIRTMLWDYAYTGSENQLMAMIPKCTDERVTQARVQNGVLEYTNGARIDCREGEAGVTLGNQRCTYVTPQYCELVQALFSVAGQKRNIMRAGGNGNFGRRTMQWQSGSEIYLSYEKRNVLGFSMDFAEDFTKSNWSTEFTYINGVPTADADAYDLNTRTDTFNLTVSVDRPTFINFLNPNRTIFINSQWFFQYRTDYSSGMGPNGPFNALATLAMFTGYYQDRLNPSLVGVYDFRSHSGAVLPSVNYRFSEAFSITVGVSLFFGRQQLVSMPVNGIAPAAEQGGPQAYYDAVFGGLSLIKDRDEVFMTLRYTF